MTLVQIGWLLSMVAFVALVFAYGIHSACVDPGPPVVRPEPGTPRADYCSVADSVRPWIVGVLVAFLAAGGTALVGRRRFPSVAIAVALVLAVVVSFLLTESLDYAYTI
jgi:hypothetical protein